MKNIIGGDYQINQHVGTLSLVCKGCGDDHAFLVFERLDSQGKHEIKVAELGYRNISEDPNNPEIDTSKAQIYYRKFSLKAIQKKGRNCQSVTSNIHLDQQKQFEQRVKDYQQVDLSYIDLGKTKLNNVLGASLDQSGMVKAKEGSLDILGLTNQSTESVCHHNYSFFSVDASLRDGHNCISWAVEMWKHLGLDYKDNCLGKFIVMHPKVEVKNQVEANNKRCLVM